MSYEIKISKGSVSVTMPKIRDISVGGEEVSTSTTMASGRVVKDVVGYRRTVTASWDYVPAESITALLGLLRQGGFYTVTYTDPKDGETSGVFDIDPPTLDIFAYRGGAPIWHNVSLTMTAQEVDP